MKGILILAHGSRVESTKNTIISVVEMVKEKVDCPVGIAYMEFCEDNIRTAVEKLVKQGVKEIKAVPYFLFEGIHIKEDIPNELNEILKDYTDVTITMGNVLGVDKRLAEILIDRIRD